MRSGVPSLEHADGYDAAGGAEILLRLANAWHAKG
jgi:hypothetical protein